jgi:hypothetical protein
LTALGAMEKPSYPSYYCLTHTILAYWRSL